MKKIMLATVLVLAFCGASYAQPITLCPSNHHYYFFQGRSTILITSAEHYGAVINKDFDYVRYLDKLKAYGLNYTRIYPGVLFEPMGKFLPGNTLGPRPASVILPWARSSQPGYLRDRHGVHGNAGAVPRPARVEPAGWELQGGLD